MRQTNTIQDAFVIILLIQCFIGTTVTQNKPGCPPPVSKFLSYPKKVVIPKLSPIKVATLTVQENSYFGSARCSLVQDLENEEIYRNFRLQETQINDKGKRYKECSIYLISDKIKESKIDLEVILIGMPINKDNPNFLSKYL